MTWSYDPSQVQPPNANTLMQVRYLVGDTNSKDQQTQDEEILFALSLRPPIYGAAAIVCRALATKLSREADSVQGDLRTLYSSRAISYAMRADEYENLASARSGGMPYAGGISISDKCTVASDADRVKPQFSIGMDDNYLPVGPAGPLLPEQDAD